ncbi:hypothetical protein FHG87_003172 [Trinorchestia longiramus]|nr:hypothetical protein FHG87_003172 [Trinorchestia longiramus]
MTSPEESLAGIGSEDDFELFDGESSHEDFMCCYDDGWLIALPFEAETKIAAFDRKLSEKVINLTAEHSSLLTASSRDLTHSTNSTENDVRFDQYSILSTNVQDSGEVLQFFHNHFDDDDEIDIDFIEEEADELDLVKIAPERLSFCEGDIHSELESDINIESLTEIAFSGMNSDYVDVQSDLLQVLSNEHSGSNIEPPNRKKSSVTTVDAVLDEIFSSELVLPREMNDKGVEILAQKNVPTLQPLVFDRGNVCDNFCHVSYRDNHASKGVTGNRSDETLDMEVISTEYSHALESDNASSWMTEMESVTKENDSDKDLSVEEDFGSAILSQDKFEAGCEEFIDVEFESHGDEIVHQYDHFPEVSCTDEY